MEVDRKTRLQRELFLRVLVLSKPSPGIARAMSEAIQDVEVAAGSTLYKTGDDPDAQYWIEVKDENKQRLAQVTEIYRREQVT